MVKLERFSINGYLIIFQIKSKEFLYQVENLAGYPLRQVSRKALF